MCPLVMQLKNRADRVQTIVCVSGQHQQMMDGVLETFGVKPDYDLSVMSEGHSLSEVTAGILERLGAVLEQVWPDIVLVHGDTTTAFSAALACFYHQIPVGHVEAGLRTYDMRAPFPEEFNRQAVRMMARIHFAPTETSRQNLLREGCAADTIHVTGNTAIDALKTTVRSDYTHPELAWADGSRLVLLTAHRRENLGEPMRHMFRAIRRVVEENADVKLIYPQHPNPLVRTVAREELSDCDRIRLIEPLDVPDFHNFLARAYLIVTDSGGIQEEAPALGKPVLVMRNTTERPEGVQAGTLKLVGTDEETIYREFSRLLRSEEQYERMSRAFNPYGDGTACEKIADILLETLESGEWRNNG